LDLIRLIRNTRKAPKKSINNVTAFFFEKNKIVGKKASRLAKQQFGFTTVQLPQCGHDYWTASAKEQMMAYLTRCIAIAERSAVFQEAFHLSSKNGGAGVLD
jgi:hypothetical protein